MEGKWSLPVCARRQQARRGALARGAPHLQCAREDGLLVLDELLHHPRRRLFVDAALLAAAFEAPARRPPATPLATPPSIAASSSTAAVIALVVVVAVQPCAAYISAYRPRKACGISTTTRACRLLRSYAPAKRRRRGGGFWRWRRGGWGGCIASGSPTVGSGRERAYGHERELVRLSEAVALEDAKVLPQEGLAGRERALRAPDGRLGGAVDRSVHDRRLGGRRSAVAA